MKVDPRPVDLNELIRQVVTSLDAGTRALCQLELTPVPAVALDPEQMNKVITNLVINAREAIGSGSGAITLTTSQTGNNVTLCVTDTGCGMSPEFLRNGLFRPFQTTKKTGLGIGMFQSRSIVEAHGGRISANSALGRGTTFRVQLPLIVRTAGNSVEEAVPGVGRALGD